MSSGPALTRKIALALALAAAPAWHPAVAQREVAAGGAYLHGPARALFPLRVGRFRRTTVYQYDTEGMNVSASYNLATRKGRLLITVYIYPAAAAAPAARSELCDEEFASTNLAISSQHDNAAPIEQGAALPVRGVDRSLGRRAVYRFASPFDDKVQAIRSEAHLYCYAGGDWLVKYRVSAPAAVKTRGPVEAFIRDGPWPGRSST